MKKFRGKALAAVLSLALIASSFPVTFASAATKTLNGKLDGDFDTDFFLVNGGSSLVYDDFGEAVSSNATMTTPDHKDADTPKIAAISHKSGDRLVKWYDDEGSGEKSSIDSDTDIANVDLELRSSTVSGEEVISILYKATYTDEDENEYTVRATKDVTIRVYDKYETVIGEVGDAGDHTADNGKRGELDSDFAQKTVANETGTGDTDSKDLTVLRAVPDSSKPILVSWDALKTLSKDAHSAYLNSNDDTNTDTYYVIKSSSDNVQISDDGGTPASFTEMTGTAADAATDPSFVIDTTGKIAITAATNPSVAIAKYTYTKGSTPAAPTKDDTPVTDGASLASELATGDKVTIAAWDAEGNAVGAATTSNATTKTDAIPGGDAVDAQVKAKASTGSLTLTAELTTWGDEQKDDGKDYVYSDSDIKSSVKVTKTIKVGATESAAGFVNLGKYSTSTYIYKGSLDKDTPAASKVKVNGYEVKFNDNDAALKVDDKPAVTKISGIVKSINIASGSVQSIALDNDDGDGDVVPELTISDAKVGDIDFDDAGGNITVDSSDASVGNITDATEVDVNGGVVGSIDADTVNVKAEDDESTVTVGDIKANKIDIDSEDSKVKTGAITASDAATEIDLHGDDVTVSSIDFDNYDVALTLDDFNGTIPAPKNAAADGASLTLDSEGDKVTVNGDANINSISISDDSTLTFTGSLEVGSIDGSGILFIGLNKLYVTSDVSGVILKLNATSYAKGDTVFTAISDTVDVDDFDCYGFTLAKTEGSSKDTFKIATTEFKGLTVDPATASITKGYGQSFRAVPYAPGTSIPAGYSIAYSLDGSDDVFDLVDNGDGSATVNVVGYDDTFAEENKATLTAELVDEDGDVDDDYDAGEVDITATLVVPVVSDTTSNFSIAPGASYTFKFTSPTAPVVTAGTGGVFSVTDVGKSGNDYFVKITAIGKSGTESGIYVNGTKLLVASIKSGITSDTTTDITVHGSYTYKITAPSAPTFSIGTGGVFSYTVSQSGNNYFLKITSIGAAGARAGIYVNGEKINVATIG